MSIIEIINNYGTRLPEKPAHIYKNSVLTYRELKNKSDALASFIIHTFGDDKTPIVVYGNKQNEMIICFLACVKAGHAYIPIDSSLPLERVKDIIINVGTSLIFDIENNYNNESIKVINSSKICSIISEYSGKEPASDYFIKNEEPFYIIYTSGSTGKPKGVQITRSCLESFVTWGLKIGEVSLEKDNVFMNQAPFSFDLSVMDLFLSLASGATLFSIDKGMISSLKDLFGAFKESNISYWVSTPSFAEMCIVDSSFNYDLLPKLNTMLFCGETLPTNLAKRINERFPGIRVVNTYGPTEATVAVTSVEINEELYNSDLALPVGYVKDDCIIKIINGEGLEVDDGEKGEIVIIGDSVSIGYINNYEMTNKVFSMYKIDGIDKRGYRTGDEGYLSKGCLYYLGRIDFQVKLNGYRIEIEDIENNLRKVNNVKNCVVIPAVNNENKVMHLVAFVTLNKESELGKLKTGITIKNELKEYIPSYMVPRNIKIIKAFPTNVNGKIDRKKLLEEM